MPGLVAAWYGDDLAFAESLLVSPRILRRYFFPWMEELAGIPHGAGFPFIMHSDGRLWPVLDDLIALGVNALHPIEPKAMDIYDLKRRYGDWRTFSHCARRSGTMAPIRYARRDAS